MDAVFPADPSEEVDDLLRRIPARKANLIREAFEAAQAARRQLAESAARMERAQSLASFGDWEWHPREDRVMWSDQLYRIVGAEPGELSPTFEAYVRYVHPEDRTRFEDTVREALEGRKPFDTEHRIVRSDGAVRVVRCRGEVATGEGGGIERVSGVCQDVSETAEAEGARGEAEARFRSAFEDAPIGIALLERTEDGGERIVEANHALCELLGQGAEELRDRPFGGFFDDAGGSPGAAAQRERLMSGELRGIGVEERLRSADGREVLAELRVSAVRGPEGATPRYAVLQVLDIGERKRFEQQIVHLADHDPLTELLNRRRFVAELEAEVARKVRYGGVGSLLILDLDRFKPVNDTFGHHAGDSLLRQVATTLEERVRATDSVARLAGDEFALLLPETARTEGIVLARELLARIRELPAPTPGASPVTASIGVATFGRGMNADAETAMIAADQAMYAAKQRGRDRVEAAPEQGREPEPAPSSDPAAAVRAGIEEGRLVLYSQPIVELDSGRTVGSELLVRLRDPAGAVLQARRFVAAIAGGDLATEVDRWVVARALGMEDGGSGTRLHVNLFASSLRDERALGALTSAISASPSRSGRLVIELASPSRLERLRELAAPLGALKDAGARLLLDQAPPSLRAEQLAAAGFEGLKFSVGAERSGGARGMAEIARRMVGLADEGGWELIATRVEDARTLAVLRTEGVHAAQGDAVGSASPLSGASLRFER